MSPISQDEIKQIAEEVHKSSPPKKHDTPPETRISDKTWLSLPLAISLGAGVFVAAGIGYAANEAGKDAKLALHRVGEAEKEHSIFRTADAVNTEQHKQILEALAEIKTFMQQQQKK